MHYPKIIDGKLILFTTKDGLKTTGFFTESSGKDVIIFIHGMGGNFYKEGFLKGIETLKNGKISFFSINTRGAEVVKDFRDLNGEHHLLGTSFERFEDCIKDIESAIELLYSMGFENIHLLGHSTGCQKILYYAYKTQDPRVKTLIYLSPAEDYEIWKNMLGDYFEYFVKLARDMVSEGKGEKIILPLYEKTGELWSARRFLSFASIDNWEARMFNYEHLEIFSKVTLPIFIALGENDEYFSEPIQWYAEKLKNAYHGENLNIEIMEGDHSFHGYENKLFKKILNFLKYTLH